MEVSVNKFINNPLCFGVFLLLITSIVACQPTTEPSVIPVERPISTLPVTMVANEAVHSSPSPSPVVTPIPTIPLTPTIGMTATTTITTNETPSFTLTDPGRILYIRAEESDDFGWSGNGDGFVYSLLLDEAGETIGEPTILSGESPIRWGPLVSSPDGSRVLILGDSEAGDLLISLYPDTGKMFDVNTIIRGPVQFFDWHPDNQQALIWIERNAIDRGLWLVNVDTGEHFTLLTEQFIFDNRLGIVGSGAISSDGQTTIYTHGKTAFSSEIWMMNADGSNRRFLWESTIIAHAFQWSPDGNSIAFIGGLTQKPEDTGVIIMSADGSNPRVVSHSYTGGHAFPLIWSPDSQMLAFNGECEGNPAIDATNHPRHFQNNIHIVNVVTGKDYPLLSDGCGNTDPIWSPDSTHVAFASIRSGYGEIWLAAKNGENLHQLTHHNGALVRFPVWLPSIVP